LRLHPRARPASRSLLCLLLVALAAGGCSVGKLVKKAFSGELQVEIVVDPKLDENSALAVDLVVISDKKLEPPILAMTARDWFRQREQFEKDHGSGFRVSSWELVPGQSVEPQTVEVGRGVETAVFFADYLSPGPHRQQIDPHRHLVLNLGEKGFSVQLRK
jgi:type VI secretion system protein